MKSHYIDAFYKNARSMCLIIINYHHSHHHHHHHFIWIRCISTFAIGVISFIENYFLLTHRSLAGYCNATADSRNGTACQIMGNVTRFSNGSLVVHFTVVFDTSVVSTLNASNIQILNENGIAYSTTVSGVTREYNTHTHMGVGEGGGR